MQEPWSVCLFAVEAPAANSNRCFLVFFSREKSRALSPVECKTPVWHAGPRTEPHSSRARRQHNLNTTSTAGPASQMLSWGVGWAWAYALKTFGQITTSQSLFLQRKACLSAAVECCTSVQYNIS